MKVGLIFPPTTYSFTAPLQAAHMLSILRTECQVENVSYVDYNQYGYYTFSRLLNGIDEKYRKDILTWKNAENIFISEAIQLYIRLGLERIMDVPARARLSNILDINDGIAEDISNALLRILDTMVRDVNIPEKDAVLIMPPSPDLTFVLLIAYLIKRRDPNVVVSTIDYYNFDSSAPYLSSLIDGKNFQGDDISGFRDLDPLSDFIRKILYDILDYVVVGEGFDVIRYLFNSNKNNRNSVNALKYHTDYEPSQFELKRRDFISDRKSVTLLFSQPSYLDGLPFPDFRDMEDIYDIAQFELSRGCVYSCVFCERSSYIPSLRFHSPEYTINALHHMEKYRFKELSFFDPALNTFPRKYLEILRSMSDSGVEAKYSFQLRPRKMDEDLLEAIEKTGGYDIGIGFESGSDRVLRDMRKGATISLYHDVLKSIFKHNFHLGPYIIFGFPTDTLSSVDETVRFIHHIKSVSDNFDIGMGWYWWGYIQRLRPSILGNYGVNVQSLSELERETLGTSYSTIIPGMTASFYYLRGMSRRDMIVAWKKYYGAADELGYQFFASEALPLNRS